MFLLSSYLAPNPLPAISLPALYPSLSLSSLCEPGTGTYSALLQTDERGGLEPNKATAKSDGLFQWFPYTLLQPIALVVI
jgi:hypothetical protein